MTTQEQLDAAFNAFWQSAKERTILHIDTPTIKELAKLAFVAGMCAGNQQALDIMRTKETSE